MPVTAKLSRKFYDTLGDDVANELVAWFNAVDLTYRTDLRELNELNHGRFMAQLAEGMTGIRADFERQLGLLRGDFERQIGGVRSDLKAEAGSLRSELKAEVGSLRAELKAEVGSLRAELKAEVGSLRSELTADIANLKSELKRDIAEARMATEALGPQLRLEMAGQRADLIKWMFLFWVGTVAVGVAGRLL
jgi:hypothetical protein